MTVLNSVACVGSIKLGKDLKEVKALAISFRERVCQVESLRRESMADVSRS